MTEDEAKQKWCPMVRQSAVFDGRDIGFSYNRSALEKTYPCHCIGSACMMWRNTIEGYTGPDISGGYSNKVIGGYCGLAGNPIPVRQY